MGAAGKRDLAFGDGPTEVVYVDGSVSGGLRMHRTCFPTGERARHFTERWPLPDGWRYEPCPHIPASP